MHILYQKKKSFKPARHPSTNQTNQPPGFHRSQGHAASADAMHSAARGIWEAYVDAMKAIDAMDEWMEL